LTITTIIDITDVRSGQLDSFKLSQLCQVPVMS